MDGTDVFAASENGKVYRMGSNSTWEYIGKPDVDVSVRAIAWCNGRLFVGTCEWTGRVYQYQGNVTWKDIGVKASYCITEVTTDGTGLFFGAYNPKYGAGGIYRLGSDDSWTCILRDVAVESLMWNGTHLFVGTHSQVLRYDGSSLNQLGNIPGSGALCWNSSIGCLYAAESAVYEYTGSGDAGHE